MELKRRQRAQSRKWTSLLRRRRRSPWRRIRTRRPRHLPPHSTAPAWLDSRLRRRLSFRLAANHYLPSQAHRAPNYPSALSNHQHHQSLVVFLMVHPPSGNSEAHQRLSVEAPLAEALQVLQVTPSSPPSPVLAKLSKASPPSLLEPQKATKRMKTKQKAPLAMMVRTHPKSVISARSLVLRKKRRRRSFSEVSSATMPFI